MAQVLKHGNTYKICICEKCKCEIEYTKQDTFSYKEERDWIWQKARWVKTFITCPECGYDVLIEKRDL